MADPVRSDICVDAVFDIETSDWTKFVVGGVRLANGNYSEFDWHKEDALIEAILAIPPAPGQRHAWVWAHNGGKFDALWFADHLADRGIKFDIIISGSAIACLTAGQLRVLDSFMLTRQRLVDLTSAFSVSKERLGLPCVCGEACGGYCSISRKMPLPQFRHLCHYLKRDCDSLFYALEALREFAVTRDIDLGITVGSSAWKTASRWLELPPNDLTGRSGDFHFAREGYFGGRVFKARDYSFGRSHFPNASIIDVNSMYPAALLNTAIPEGPCLGQVYGKTARSSYMASRPGIYAATVSVPESYIPPLPVSDVDGRVCYPWGKFQGVWPLPELEYAESLGCKVEAYRAVCWGRAEKTFAPWARRLFDIRVNSPGGKKSPLGNFVKFLLNALTGKLGARGELERAFFDPDLAPERRICRCNGICKRARNRREEWTCACRGRCKRWCEGQCGCVLPADDNEDHRFWKSHHFRIQECARPQVAAYLTGVSRGPVWHHQAVAYRGGEDVCYGDTDSLWTEQGRTENIGKDIGQWDIEAYFSDTTFVAPKTYEGQIWRPGEAKPERKVGAKGVRAPLPGLIIPPVGGTTILLDSGQRVRGVRGGLKEGKFFEKQTLKRRVSWQWGDRFPLGDGTSRAPNASELELYKK